MPLRKNDCVLRAKPAPGQTKLLRRLRAKVTPVPMGCLRQSPLRRSHVLRYLGRYTHRVAISNHRLLRFDGDTVTFRWRDYAHGNVQRVMTLAAEEFIRRFLLHVLPKGFVRIRHFGFMANYQRSASFELSRRLLGMAPVLLSQEIPLTGTALLCPVCQVPMTVVDRLTPAQIAWRFLSTCFLDTS